MSNDIFILLEKPIDKELHYNSFKVLNESTGNGKTKIEAILQDFEVENRNRRIYRLNDMLKFIKAPYMIEQLQAKGLKGEFGHPMDSTQGRQTRVEPTKVSHRILSFDVRGDYLYGIIEANGPYGKYFEEDIRDGELPAFSFRGTGSIEKINGRNYAKLSYATTWDRVYYPSHKVAYMTKVLTESANNSDEEENQLVFTESVSILITDNKVNQFIKDESRKLKRISEALDVNVNEVKYNKNTNTVKVSSHEGTSFLYSLDEYVKKQLI